MCEFPRYSFVLFVPSLWFWISTHGFLSPEPVLFHTNLCFRDLVSGLLPAIVRYQDMHSYSCAGHLPSPSPKPSLPIVHVSNYWLSPHVPSWSTHWLGRILRILSSQIYFPLTKSGYPQSDLTLPESWSVWFVFIHLAVLSEFTSQLSFAWFRSPFRTIFAGNYPLFHLLHSHGAAYCWSLCSIYLIAI